MHLVHYTWSHVPDTAIGGFKATTKRFQEYRFESRHQNCLQKIIIYTCSKANLESVKTLNQDTPFNSLKPKPRNTWHFQSTTFRNRNIHYDSLMETTALFLWNYPHRKTNLSWDRCLPIWQRSIQDIQKPHPMQLLP